MEFSITEELATLMLMKKIITVADLHKEVEMVLQNPDIPTQSLSFRRSKGESSLVTNETNNTDHHLITYYYLINQENMCANISK
jgi:hypothetical protein